MITTNKTDFFREPNHFDLLTQKVLPEICERGKPLLIWSAACSTGEEPYTMAMVLSEYATNNPGFRFRILATDISTEVLERGGRVSLYGGGRGAGACCHAEEVPDAQP